MGISTATSAESEPPTETLTAYVISRWRPRGIVKASACTASKSAQGSWKREKSKRPHRDEQRRRKIGALACFDTKPSTLRRYALRALLADFERHVCHLLLRRLQQTLTRAGTLVDDEAVEIRRRDGRRLDVGAVDGRRADEAERKGLDLRPRLAQPRSFKTT